MKFDPTSASPTEAFDPGSAVPEESPPVRAVLQAAVKQNPDQVARAAVLGKQYGVPTDLVVRNLKDIEFQAMVDKADERLKTSPKLAAAMRKRPDIAPMAHDDIEPLAKIEEAVSRTVLGTAGDIGVVAAKGAVGLPQAFAGLAGLVTGGYAGKVLEAVGVRFEDAQKILDSMYSPAQQRSNLAVKEAQGFVDTIVAMVSNPSTIATAVGESAPQMLGGMAVGRGLIAAAPKLAPWLAAAMGEGVMGAGSAAEQARTEDTDGLLSVKTTFASLMSGAGTALFGAAGGKVAQRMGLADIDTVLVKGGMDAANAGAVKKGFISSIAKAGISEGAFEELPQSVQETMWANWGADRPLGEGVGKAAAQGLLAGMAMGGGFQAAQSIGEKVQQIADKRQLQIDNATYQSEQLAEQLKTAGAAALRERSPEQFRALMGEMTDGKIYVDGEVLNQLPEDVRASLPQAVQDQIATAAATGDVVEITTADALTIAPGTALEEVLVEHARTDPFAMSKADAAEAAKLAQSQVMTDAQRVIQQAQDTEARQAEYDQIHKLYADQLNAAARFRPAVNEAKAHWLASFYTTMAARTGMTPAQFQAAHPVSILGAPSSAGQVVMDQPKLGEIAVEGYHFSKADRPVITTAAFGTGLQGSGRDDYLNAVDRRLSKRAYFYVDKGTGINPEAGVGGRGHRAALKNVYDADTDPLRLAGGSQTDFETKVLDAGFSGYLNRLDGTQSGQAVMLGDQTIQPEMLGALGKTSGKVVPGKGPRSSNGRYQIVDALQANTALPSGSPTLARWQELLAGLPEVLDALREAGVFDGDQAQTAYKSDLIKQFQGATEAPVYAQRAKNITPAAAREQNAEQALEELTDAYEQTGNREGRYSSGGFAPLDGAPAVAGATGPDPRLVAVAEQYAADTGINLRRQARYAEVDPERAKRIAGAYEAMLHAPNDPAVKEGYADLNRQTMAQYQALVSAGYRFTFFDSTSDPYAGNPWNAMRDLRANQRMAVYGTYDGFGTDGVTGAAIENNPMLADTGLQWPDQAGAMHPVTANDLFRAVHDAFGHGLEGAGFRAQGEENAWQAHHALFTGPAVGAITSETRGQNSWLNYGPHGEKNQTAKVEDTVFAEQKTGLMPEWTWTEGVVDASDVFEQSESAAFKKWFGDSKVVDAEGKPLVVYHGTDTGGFTSFNRPGGAKRGDLGIFATDNRAMAASYVKRGRAKDITADQLGEDFDRVSGLYPTFMSLQNPFEVDMGGAIFDGSRPGMFEVYDANGDIAYDANGNEFTERDAAEALADEIGGTFEDASPGDSTDSLVRQARSMGFDGVIIRNVVDEGGGDSSYAGEPSDVFVAFAPEQIKSAIGNDGTFDANDPRILNQQAQTPRGTFNPATLELVLNPNANLSTFFHETGHFFLEVMADIASQPNAPAQIVEDFNTFLAWAGVEDVTTWTAMTLDQKRKYHERWAESIEQYVMEGKAPSVELQPLMRRFSTWLKSVYGSIKQFLASRGQAAAGGEVLGQDPAATEPGPPMALNDDIRRVMDRLLATDEQIAQANEVAGLVPDVDADAAAGERLAKRSIADLKWSVRARDQVITKLRKQAAAIEKDLREQVTVEVDQTPEMRAKRALDALTVSPEYAGTLAEHKTARKVAEATVREEVKAVLLAENPDVKGLIKGQLLMKNKRDIDNKVDAAMIKWDQANPTPTRPVNQTDADVATVADSFGFESVDAMLQAIDAFGSRRDAIDGLTEKRMLEEHGDLIDERAISEAANEAVHNEARARSLASELRTQSEMLNTRTDTGETNTKGSKITVNALVEAAKQFAANVVSRTALRDLTSRAWQHTAAERRAAKRWTDATAAGKTAEAVKAKQDQMLNHAAAKAAIDAKAEAKKILDFFKRVTKGNDETVVDKGRDPDIVNAARAALAAYGVQGPASKSAADYLKTLSRNDPETYNVILPMVEGATRNAQPLDAITFEELQALNEEIQAMWFLAKRSRQMEVDGRLLDVQDVADEVYTRLEEIGIPDTLPGETGALTNTEIQARRWLQQVPALLRRVEQWAEAKDGKFGGPFSRYIFQPVKDAADRYRADRLIYRQKFQALVDNVAPLMPAKTIAAPELGYVFGRGHNGIGMSELLHAIAHTGNESNKRKLLLGRNWAADNGDGTLDTSRWDAFIKRLVDEGTLRREHFNFVQGVWDLMEQTKPLAQKTHRAVFGRYFAEVTADAFVDPFGVTRSGGYIPAQADPLLVTDADLRELLETDNAGMSQAFPATNKGFTKSRVEYNRPLKLDLRTLPQHIDKVLLFSHMEPAVRGVTKLLRQPKVSQPLARVDPAAIGGMLKPWLNRSARQTVETPVSADAGMNRVLSTVRARVGMALMFANVSNTLQQITGFSAAALKVKPALMMRATAQFIAHPKQFKDAVWALSPYMADRASNEVAVLSDTMEKILINPGVFARAESWTRQHAYFLQTAMDNAMSPIIWSGAYNQGVAEGMDERMAIRYADGVIRQTQGSTLPEDVSRIETGPAYARVFTQFISYFNMLANTNGTALQQIAAEQGLKKGAGKAFGVVMLGLLAPIWVAETIAHGMRGGPDDEDDDGYLDDWLAAVFGFGTIRGLLSGVPIVGVAAQSAVNRFNSQPADDKFSLSPTVSVLESAVGAPASVYGAIVGDKNAQKAVRDVSALITVATGLPGMAAARPLGYLAGVAQGRIEPTGPADAVRGLVTGTASPESKQR